ncbi:MAG: hypothetical protein ACLUEJ_06110 [Clostridium sp.]
MGHKPQLSCDYRSYLAGGREQNELKAYAAMEGTLVFLMGFTACGCAED